MLKLSLSVKQLMFALLALVVMTSAGCGFQLQGSYSIPPELSKLSLESSDKYSELSRLVRERLRLNNVGIEEPAKGIPRLVLLSDTLERSTLSLYPTATSPNMNSSTMCVLPCLCRARKHSLSMWKSAAIISTIPAPPWPRAARWSCWSKRCAFRPPITSSRLWPPSR